MTGLIAKQNTDPIALQSPEGQRLARVVLTYLIKDLKPITVVDSAGFKFLLDQFNPRFKLPTKNYFRDNLLPHVFEEVKAQVILELGENIERHAITTDDWTSQDTVDYVTTTVHFNSNYELKSFVLQTLPLGSQHTAENMANLMRDSTRLEFERYFCCY